MKFFRYPHTPHLAWLGEGQPRDDKVLAPEEAEEFLADEVLVEEKMDGANIGFSVDSEGDLRVQNRGQFISPESCHPQFATLFQWLRPMHDQIAEALIPDLILFGEWCYAVHTVRYNRLPDWFLAFDVYDQHEGEFWSAERRDRLVLGLGLKLVPRLGHGRYDVGRLVEMLGTSQVGDESAEGICVKREHCGSGPSRAKIVRPEFVQSIGEHWTRRKLETNRLAENAPRVPPHHLPVQG